MKRQNSTKPFQITKRLFNAEHLQNDKQKAPGSKFTEITGNSHVVGAFFWHAVGPRNHERELVLRASFGSSFAHWASYPHPFQ